MSVKNLTDQFDQIQVEEEQIAKKRYKLSTKAKRNALENKTEKRMKTIAEQIYSLKGKGLLKFPFELPSFLFVRQNNSWSFDNRYYCFMKKYPLEKIKSPQRRESIFTFLAWLFAIIGFVVCVIATLFNSDLYLGVGIGLIVCGIVFAHFGEGYGIKEHNLRIKYSLFRWLSYSDYVYTDIPLREAINSTIQLEQEIMDYFNPILQQKQEENDKKQFLLKTELESYVPYSTCSVCDHKIIEEDTFCSKCGIKLP